jgi:hypothetical protein
MSNNRFDYGIKNEYQITPNTEAADFLQSEVQNFFGYQQKSKREKYADVWIKPNYGINVKTDNLCSQQNQGRLCTAAVNEWLQDEQNTLKFIFISYTNIGGLIKIKEVVTKYLEEIEYRISNQGKGLLQPVRDRNYNVVFRKKISRKEWLLEFKRKYRQFIEKQQDKFEKLKAKWC